jgi:diguanylate cyclase (GGDEF)-like protein
VVDDHEDNIEVLRARPRGARLPVEAAHDGEEALERVFADPPDLVLLDWMMPRLDGMEVTRRIKARAGCRSCRSSCRPRSPAPSHMVEGLDAGRRRLHRQADQLRRARGPGEGAAAHQGAAGGARPRANDELRRVSQTDGLTGVDNRRHIEERLTEAFEHAARLNEPLAVVMTDVDHFKSVNDTYGHQAGDAVLRQVAEALRDTAREIDRVGRYGGEEFLVLLPGANLEDARHYAERARAAVAGREFAYEGGSLRRTLSAGVAAWPHPDVRHQEALVKLADDALYAAKTSGRNRVVAHGDPEAVASAAPPAPAAA